MSTVRLAFTVQQLPTAGAADTTEELGMSEQDPSVTNLPEKPEITRRDFVGGTLVGTGSALLAMASPGAGPHGAGADSAGEDDRVLEFEYDCCG